MEINKQYILELSRGLFELQESEKRKLEFKRQWYDLSGNSPGDNEEFCKDMAAMANTPGPPGFIVIGLDESNGNLINSPISNSGLTDTQLVNLIIKRVRPSIQFEIDTIKIEEDQDKVISVIKIPSSLEKPHVMSLYKKYDGIEVKHERQNYIPIRHNTQIFPANHVDLEYMFYDRKNVIHDYKVEFLQVQHDMAVNVKKERGDDYLTCTLRFVVQNVGLYPVAISSANLRIFDTSPRISTLQDIFNCSGSEWVLIDKNITGHINYSLPSSPIILPYNSMQELRVEFWSIDVTKKLDQINFDTYVRRFREIQHYRYSISLNSINGRTFSSDTWEV